MSMNPKISTFCKFSLHGAVSGYAQVSERLNDYLRSTLTYHNLPLRKVVVLSNYHEPRDLVARGN